MAVEEAFAQWHDFYAASAGVAAVLLGLVFVGISIHYDIRNIDRRLVTMATESAVPFFYASLASLAMLIPVSEPWTPTILLVVVGLLTAVNAGTPFFARWYSGATDPRPGHRLFDRLRFVMPVVAGLGLVIAAIALLAAPEPSLYAICLVVLVLLAFGMQNAWDTLLRRDLRDLRTTSGAAAAGGGPTAGPAREGGGSSAGSDQGADSDQGAGSDQRADRDQRR
jgi:hypothetical protein